MWVRPPHLSRSDTDVYSQPNFKQLQTDLSGFLTQDAAPFCLELSKLCLSAQANPQGIPKELLEAKKTELIQERVSGYHNRRDRTFVDIYDSLPKTEREKKL